MARYNDPLRMRVSAVKFLIAANVVVFLLQSASPDAIEALFALWPLQPDGGPSLFRLWQIVTYAFLHDTQHIAHLLFNMWGLWMFGAEIERYVGPRRLLDVLLRLGAHRGADTAVRAGAVRSAAGAHHRCLGRRVRAASRVRADVSTAQDHAVDPAHPDAGVGVRHPVCGIELLLGVTSSLSGVAHFAHLGGMVGSALVVMQWRRRKGAMTAVLRRLRRNRQR